MLLSAPTLVYLPVVARIRLLPDALINQIAAGEVVERPASVVKELVENSLDAGARSIVVHLEQGGRTAIEVEDDGCGMDHDDALLALERHATSKIATDADLAAITTLGFRGEALPAISAVSEMELETATADGEGTRIDIAFGRIRATRPCARRRGTRVAVRDLFAQLPARRKFLRSEGTELRHVVATITALAFAHLSTRFALTHGKRTVLDLPPVRDAAQRLPDLVGHERARSARPVRHHVGAIAVTGFLLPPTPTRDLVVLVNDRVVRDRLLSATVNRALRAPTGVLEADAYLNLRLPPDQVDVNVHPTKAEVRFADPGRVLAALTQALAAARIAIHGPADVRRIVTVSSAPRSAPSLPFAPAPPAPTSPFAVSEAAPQSYSDPPPETPSTPLGRYLGQYRDTYLLVEDDDGLLLVDQHAAHERVLYERFLDADSPHTVQGLLIPELVELTPDLAALAAELTPDLELLGVEIEPASGSTLRVLGMPAALPVARVAALVRQLLADLADPSALAGETLRERVAASLSCQAAIKKHRSLPRPEAERLLAEVASLRDPHRCPHGRPTSIRLLHSEIERRIGRK
jgi:DNA mismatch repair protein MutL